MQNSEETLQKSNSSKEEDAGFANEEHASTLDPNHVTNDKSGISNTVGASESLNGERKKTSKDSKDSRNGRKTKRKKKGPTQRNNSNDNKTRSMPLKSNYENAGKGALTGQTHASKRKRNGRLVRLVSINTKKNDRETAPPTTSSISRTTSVPPLPRTQYMATLRRRAIRKQESYTSSNCDEYGDISLGMKIIVAGGQVVVQSLNSLSDGLASPAQLAGVVQRGDVLLAIGNLSLANLPINQLMEGLSPLSTPDSGGLYERCLDLRFEAGAGLGLLILHEQEHARSRNNLTADPMLSMFPMVDQLSGTPLFEPQYNTDTYRDENFMIEGNDVVVEEAKDNFLADDDVVSNRKTLDEVLDKFSLNFDSLISAVLAKERNSDRERYESEYFDWREDISNLLRTTIRMGECQNADPAKILTKVERLEVGHKIMRIAKFLELNLEEIDKGHDIKSQKNWNSGISIRSGSSTIVKRQYNMDGTITSFLSDNPLDEESIDSDGSLDDVDPDKLLLGLAARDEIWRKLVITMLNKAAKDIKSCGEEKSKDASPPTGAIDLTQQLGHFLFRENTSKIFKEEMKSFAFPPPEITRIIFDLATFIATSAHDDITVFGASSKISSNISSLRSGATKVGVRGRASVRGDILLAKRFILDEALPHWLQSFRPLKLDQRVILWPRQNSRSDSMSNTGTVNRSEYTGRFSDVDNLTLDSEGSRVPIRSTQRKKKDSREAGNYRVVDHENELKSETCFLVTYFCTEKIIGSDRDEGFSTINRNSFVQTYGAYLQIQTCLSFASFVKDKAAISEILKVAKDDPNHRDAMKDIQESNHLLFYDSRKLSAVLQCMEDIRFETNGGRRKQILDLCASGYPDIQPWQVRTACLSFPQSESNETRDHCSNAIMEDLYYTYLCDLLNPVDGHEAAREDSNLLKEFCEWSVGIDPKRETNPTRMKNFMNIAAPSSNHQNSYRRDLMMLLDLSSAIENHNLSLDLVDEIIGNGKLSSNEEALRRALYCLRRIGSVSLVLCSDVSKETMGFDTLRLVLKLFEKMSTNHFLLRRNFINIPDEIFTLFQQWKIQKGSSGDDADMFHLIDFVMDVSSIPADVIKALLLWSFSHNGNSLFSRLEDLLRCGIHFAVLNGEFSGTLLRLKHARTTFKELDSSHDQAGQRNDDVSIWERMGQGIVSIEK